MNGRTEEEVKELFTIITERMITGKSLKDILKDETIPITRSTFYRYLDKFESARDMYARAVELRAHYLLDDIISIADDDTEDVRSRAVRVDTRKWVMSKLLPKVYGNKIDVTTKDEQVGTVSVEIVRHADTSD